MVEKRATIAGSIDLFGINLAGAEFGGSVKPADMVGSSHFYPSRELIDRHASEGFDVIRLPFKWERLQPTTGGPLDQTELRHVRDVVTYAEGKGIAVVLDPHDFGSGYGKPIGSGVDDTPTEAFADFWARLAGQFVDSPNVIFGLMNEPHLQTAAEWLVIANAAIEAIRGVGADQQILVPGTYYGGAGTWTTTDNARVLGAGIHDRLDNFAFEVHQYLDRDGSGAYDPDPTDGIPPQFRVESATIGVERLEAVTAWAETTGNRLFLGEFGVASDEMSLTALRNMLDYMRQHSDVWQGATYWAGGSHWGDYAFAIEPIAGVERPQLAVLRDYVSPDAQPFWEIVGAPTPSVPVPPEPAPPVPVPAPPPTMAPPIPELPTPPAPPPPELPLSVLPFPGGGALGAAGRRDVDFLLRADGEVVLAQADGQLHSLRGISSVSFVDGEQSFDLSGPAARVYRLYRAALDREPEQAGLNYGIDVLRGGAPLATLSTGLLGSPEFAARYGTELSGEQFVARLYENILDRVPTADEMGFYLRELGGGAARSQILAAFSESPEHIARTSPLLAGGIWDVSESAALVARLYDTMLGRLPDVAGLKFHRERIDQGAATPETVIGNFENSPEFVSRYGAEPSGAAFVQLLYQNALGRSSDAAEQSYYLAQIGAGLTREQLVLAFSESPEHASLTRGSIVSDDPNLFGIAFA